MGVTRFSHALIRLDEETIELICNVLQDCFHTVHKPSYGWTLAATADKIHKVHARPVVGEVSSNMLNEVSSNTLNVREERLDHELDPPLKKGGRVLSSRDYRKIPPVFAGTLAGLPKRSQNVTKNFTFRQLW